MNTRTTRASKRWMAAAAAAAVGASMVVAGSASATDDVTTARLSGDDRFGTAAAVNADEDLGMNDCDVTIVNGRNFPDGLAAARYRDAILLADTDSLPAETVAELERLNDPDGEDCGGETVRIVGGTSVISSEVKEQIEDLTGEPVQRISGDDRYGTALAVAKDAGHYGTVILATGENFPDALAAGPLSADERMPILLNNGASLRADVAQFLVTEGVTTVIIVGGDSVIPAAVEATLEGPLGLTVERLAGSNRAATAVAIAEYLIDVDSDYENGVFLVNGNSFADALAAGPFGYYWYYPILLVDQDGIPAATAAHHVKYCKTIGQIVAIGGTSAISKAVLDGAKAAAKCVDPAVSSATLALDLKARVMPLYVDCIESADRGGGDTMPCGEFVPGTGEEPDEFVGVDGAKLTAVHEDLLGSPGNDWKISFVASATDGPLAVVKVADKTIEYTDDFDSMTSALLVSNWNGSAASAYFTMSLGAGESGGVFNVAPFDIGADEGTTLGSFSATLVVTFNTKVDAPGVMEITENQNPNPLLNSDLLSTGDAVRTPATWPLTGGGSTVTYKWTNQTGGQPVIGSAGLNVEVDDLFDTVTGEGSVAKIVPLTAPAPAS